MMCAAFSQVVERIIVCVCMHKEKQNVIKNSRKNVDSG